MRRNRFPILKKTAGLLLVIMGFSVLWIGIPLVIPLGLLQTLIFGWLVTLSFVGGVFLLIDLGFKRSMRAILIGFGITIPWSLIMLIQLTGESQFLLASLVALVGVLFYRWYYQKHKPQKTAHIGDTEEKQKKVEPQQVSYQKPAHEALSRHSLLRKIIASLLLIVGGFLFFTIFPFVTLDFGPFEGWLVLIPISLIMTVGYYLFVNRKLKAAIQTWIGIVFATFLPYIVLFPVVYQILSVCILAIAFVSFLYWYRSRYLKSRSEAYKQDKNTSS